MEEEEAQRKAKEEEEQKQREADEAIEAERFAAWEAQVRRISNKPDGDDDDEGESNPYG